MNFVSDFFYLSVYHCSLTLVSAQSSLLRRSNYRTVLKGQLL